MSLLSRPHWILGGPASAVDHLAGTCNIKCKDTKSSKYANHESISRCANERGKPGTNYRCPAVRNGGPVPQYVAYVIVFLGGIRCNWVPIGHFDGIAANGQRPSCVRSRLEIFLTTCKYTTLHYRTFMSSVVPMYKPQISHHGHISQAALPTKIS